ncbi:hypothetical protein [Chromobacterium sphagni]|uniref:Uncharacterized protein n=1 Tax=Chromobacterium sphagni TaxID=1903179 RepID=A0A1S1X5Z7_9NEIS|nr:hypothetical protein [Chromobacterium sphagni]OHX14903.1 hypothetical protein BI347_05370 [Chromobacterium sphagni]OHX19392.1 hypothetical protein BI344_09110 [Chromobacterium sphagni]
MSFETASAVSSLSQLLGQIEDDGTIALSDIREKANQELSYFANLAQQELHQFDISMPPAISLVSNDQCRLELENQHPHQAEIHNWLDGNLILARKFKEIEVLFELVRATESAGELFSENSNFHIGLTSAGPIAYFEDHHSH